MSIERLRAQLERLKEQTERQSGIVNVQLRDGTVARFNREDMKEAFLSLVDALEAHGTDELPEPHPFRVAVANSINPAEHGFFSGAFGIVDKGGEPFVGPVPDLAEQGQQRE